MLDPDVLLTLSSSFCRPAQHFNPILRFVLYQMHSAKMVSAPRAATTIATNVGRCMLPSLEITDHLHPLSFLKCLNLFKILSLANPIRLWPVLFLAWIENGNCPLFTLDSVVSSVKLCITPLVILGMSKWWCSIRQFHPRVMSSP